ncbi:hypothetical protein EJB05_28160, partial [Eragrostis curvula]
MDPDPLDAGGDLADTATTHVDGGGGGGEESWARALLRRGWDLSLKAAIAGAAVTAAPVVGPPIIILSIAGVALSVPFAAYLASLAATDRLMGALLPPAPPQPYHTYGFGDEDAEQEFMDAPEATDDEAPVFGRWRKTEDAVVEQDESFASLPLSLEPRHSEELVPLLACEDGEIAEGEFAIQKSDHLELFAPKDGKQEENGRAMEVDSEYITMEAPSPGDVSGSAVPLLHDESKMVQGMEEAPIPVKKTEDDNNVSESSVPDDNTVLSKIEEEMAPEEVMSDTNPITVEVVGVQPDVIATTVPESESSQSSDQVSREIQAMTKSADVYDTLGSTLTQGVVKDVGDKDTGDVEHHGEVGVCTVVSVPSVVAEDDGKDLVSSRAPYVSAISNDTISVESRLHSGEPRQTAEAVNKELGKEEVTKDKCVKTEESKTMDGKVSSTELGTQDDHVPKSPVPDDRKKGDNEVRVEMVLQEVTSIAPVTGEAIEIIASESESLPLSELVAHDLQAVTEAGMPDDRTEDAVKGIGDTSTNSVKRLSEGGACSSVTSVLTMDDSEDLMSNRSTTYASAISDDMTSIEGRADVDHHHSTTDVGYKVMDEEFGMKEVTEDKDIYTEEQLREQLDTLRTITGYRAVPSLTLEGDLAGLYIFVGVEPPHSSGDASNLMELSTKLRFLKSIIGVE